MAGDELVRGVTIAVLLPALGQHEFLLRFQHWEPPDFFQISSKSAFGGNDRQSRSTGHDSALQVYAPGSSGRRCVPPLPEPTTLVCGRYPDRSAHRIPDRMGRKEEEPPSHPRDPRPPLVAPL